MGSRSSNVRQILGIPKSSSTWESLVKEFRTWHRDPAYPERRYRTLTSPGFKTGVSGFAAYLAAKYLTAANSELEPTAQKWPNDSETVLKQLYRFAAYEGSENKRPRNRLTPKTQRVISRVHHPVTNTNPPQPPQASSTGNIESSLCIIDAADESKALISVPVNTSTIASAGQLSMPVQRPARIERRIRTHTRVDLAYAETAEASNVGGSYHASHSQTLQPFQATLNEHQLAYTTLFVGISTSTYAKSIPFTKVSTTNAFKTAVIDIWCLDAAMKGRIEMVTVRYPWASSRQTEFVLGDEEAYKHMQRQIMGCPCWQVQHGTCVVEVELVMKEVEMVMKEERAVENVIAEMEKV